MTTLAGRVALVTGGAKGIGRAITEGLAAEGASVVFGDVDEAAAEEVLAAAKAKGTDVRFLRCDVTAEADIQALTQAAVDLGGRLDIAVNNAGTTPGRKSLGKLELSDWNLILAVNLTSVFLGLRSQMPAMAAGGGGTIVNVASTAGFRGSVGLGGYSASKHGVIGLTRSAALEGAAKGVRVNAVCPGAIETPLMERTFNTEAERAAIARLSPMGRMGTPQEASALAVWLCRPEASFVTGAVLTVDGGMTAQ